jgi:hypothetical protein
MFAKNKKDVHGLIIRAYQGDAKVMLAFNLPEDKITNLAGFTIACSPKGKATYFLYNQLQLEHPEKHAQNKNEPPYSSINAPIQKFRWLHVPGGFHQMDKVAYGSYTYTVTPRYFDEGILQPIDKKLSEEVVVEMSPFVKESLELGFTRGFVQSQGFVHHFGKKALFKPKNAKLLFNTSAEAGKNDQGESYTFKDEYRWSGFTAREKIFSLLQKVQSDDSLTVDVFAYDLNEPDILKIFLELARENKIRIIMDNAALHHDKDKPTPEDQFEAEYTKVASDPQSIKRGKFGRYQHNKVFIVKRDDKPESILTGSTNFSVTGMYVNSNHVAIFNDAHVAEKYQEVFEEAWNDEVSRKEFIKSSNALKSFSFNNPGLPKMHISFSPHPDEFAKELLDKLVGRINEENSSVFFAVMGTDEKVKGPVAPALIKLHEREDVFTCGITDSTNELTLYKPSSKEGLRVTGKQGKTFLPPPFDEEASIGIGHQVHHKFIVCGFNTNKPVVWFGSSNLALGGEEQNGDNLIEIHDEDIATVFAIEAMALVDHFQFRNKHVLKNENEENHSGPFHLFNNGKWAGKFYEPNDLHCLDRLLFIGEPAVELKTIDKKEEVTP